VGSRLVALTPVGRSKFGFALTVGAQFAEAFGSTDEVPISQRYYLGGRTSIRGFRENSLGPRGSNGAVIGGDSEAYSSLELRYRILDKVSLHTFVDAGNVFLQSDNSSFNLEKSVGMGVSYLSPIGPIGFDVGHPLGSPEGQSSIRFHFTIGSGF
jgi:outer membrane protein insertion porin family